MKSNINCCGGLMNIVSSFKWFSTSEEPNKFINPHIAGIDTMYQVNNYPCCGTSLHGIVIESEYQLKSKKQEINEFLQAIECSDYTPLQHRKRAKELLK